MSINILEKKIFNINDDISFKSTALEVFNFQAKENPAYKKFIQLLNIDIKTVKELHDIPFLPIQFFKSHKIISNTNEEYITFLSSGTTGNIQSKHFVTDISVYEKSYIKGFEHFYGNIKDYAILGLLPSYLEREGSSLIYMVNDLIKKSSHPESGFYLNNHDALIDTINELENKKQKTILIGVSFALLDLLDKHKLNLKHTMVMETGGMKGKRKELIRKELHENLKTGFGIKKIHSEYGMTELLSQAYSKGNGIFNSPPWMKILIRDTENPFSFLQNEKTGGINIIDLANINSCSFIATQDLGKTDANGNFEIIGRFDNSDIRGCNLMVL